MPELPTGGHSTRDIVFSADGKRLWVAVGSASNVDDPDTNKGEFHRANVLEYTPEGQFVRVYASAVPSGYAKARGARPHACSIMLREPLISTHARSSLIRARIG